MKKKQWLTEESKKKIKKRGLWIPQASDFKMCYLEMIFIDNTLICLCQEWLLQSYEYHVEQTGDKLIC